ncbi:MAG TPA: hypothetical protein VFY40_01105 [Blastocatellia bacterium]|nr:hypothetical protein [Blastocatellia bacterium]
MNQQDNRETNNQSIIIEDLSAQNAEKIKGGPTPKSRRDVILKTGATEGQSGEDGALDGATINH